MGSYEMYRAAPIIIIVIVLFTLSDTDKIKQAQLWSWQRSSTVCKRCTT